MGGCGFMPINDSNSQIDQTCGDPQTSIDGKAKIREGEKVDSQSGWFESDNYVFNNALA